MDARPDGERTERYGRTRAVLCPACDYEVGDLSRGVCPKCGLNFEGPIRAVLQWRAASRRRVRVRIIVSLLTILAAYAPWALALTDFMRAHRPNYFFAIVGGVPILGFAIVGWVATRTVRRELRLAFQQIWWSAIAWLYAPVFAGVWVPMTARSLTRYFADGIPRGDRRWNDVSDLAIGWTLRIHCIVIPFIAVALWRWQWQRETRLLGEFRRSLRVRAVVAGIAVLLLSTLPPLLMWVTVCAHLT